MVRWYRFLRFSCPVCSEPVLLKSLCLYYVKIRNRDQSTYLNSNSSSWWVTIFSFWHSWTSLKFVFCSSSFSLVGFFCAPLSGMVCRRSWQTTPWGCRSATSRRCFSCSYRIFLFCYLLCWDNYSTQIADYSFFHYLIPNNRRMPPWRLCHLG